MPKNSNYVTHLTLDGVRTVADPEFSHDPRLLLPLENFPVCLSDTHSAKALILRGAKDLREEVRSFPSVSADHPILALNISCGVCKSEKKLYNHGQTHSRTDGLIDLATKGAYTGHENTAIILAVHHSIRGETFPKTNIPIEFGRKIVVQAAMEDTLTAPGYSFSHIGGHGSLTLFSADLLKKGNLIPTNLASFYQASSAEPYACFLRAMRAQNHNPQYARERPTFGLKSGGATIIQSGTGFMGAAAVDLILHGDDDKPKLLVVTGRSTESIEKMKKLFPENSSPNVILKYVVQPEPEGGKAYDPTELLQILKHHMPGQKGFDDVFIFYPSQELNDLGVALMDNQPKACLNIFAGASDDTQTIEVSSKRCHYLSQLVLGTTGSGVEDLVDILRVMHKLHPEKLIVTVGGFQGTGELIRDSKENYKHMRYPFLDLPTIDLRKLRGEAARFRELGDPNTAFICNGLAVMLENSGGFITPEAEAFIFQHAKRNPIHAVPFSETIQAI